MFARLSHTMPKVITAVLLLLVLGYSTTHAGSTLQETPGSSKGGVFHMAPEVVTITASKTDSLVVDVDGDTQADPGDTLGYTIVVSNSGDEDALGTTFTDVTDDTELTVVAGSLRATPIGRNDSYNVIGNTHITHPIGTGLLANDIDPDGGALTASCSPCTTANGGTVTLNANGSFTYNPPVSFTGSDTFTYTVTDPHSLTDTGTVTFSVANRIWWVDSDAAAGDGRSTTPFNTIGAAQTASLVNDIIFVYNRGANYTGGFLMKDGQRLCGHGFDLATCSGLTPPTGTTFPTVSTNPTIINGAGNGVTLAQNNTINGLTLGNSGAAANFALFGTNFGTLNLQTVTINTNNGGISLDTGTATATFTSVTSTGGTNNITLTSVNGNLILGSGALTGASGNAVNIVGGTAAFSTTATITNTSAKAVNIQSKTGGTVTFGGAINSVSGGTGITLLNNTGATITFAGSMTLNTGTNTAFSATGGGTISALTGIHTMTTTTGTGINIRNMIIGVTGFTVRSVTTNGAPNGIYLQDNTGTGAFTITGTGVVASGGTIQNGSGANGSTDGIGIYMNNNTHSVSLNWMQLNGFSNFAIRGITVSNVNISNSVVSGTNGNDAASDEGSISFDNLTGTATVTNLTVSGGHEDNFRVVNSSGVLNFTMTGSTVRDNTNVSPGNNGLWLQADSTANITANITTSSFLRNRANGIQAITNGSGIMDITIGTNGVAGSGGIFQDNNIGVNIAHNSSGTLNFDVQNGTFQAVASTTGASPININLGSLGNQMSGNIRNNVITNNNSPTGPGMRIIGNGAGTMTILVNNNAVSQIGNRGIEIIARDGSNTINATVTNNTVTLTDPLSADGIRADAGAVSTDTTTICANFSNNTSTTIVGLNGIRVRQRFAGTTYRLQGYGGSATDMTAVQNFLSTNNNGAVTMADFAGTGFQNGSCPIPTEAPALIETVEQLETAESTALDTSTSPVNEPVLQETAVTPLPIIELVNTGDSDNHSLDAETAETNTTTSLAPEATTTVGPFTLPPGESTTISFQAVIQNPFPAAQNPICNQAAISGSNFSNVLSDDPAVAGSSDPTCTTVQINADLSITKTDGATTEIPGTSVTYTIVASNAGPNPDPAAIVADTFPATITGVTWTCVGAGGATCTASGSGNINQTVNLPVGGSVTFTAIGTINPAATGTLANTTTAATSTGITDPVPANNSATDTDTLTPQVDVSITKTDGQTEDIPGTSITYTIVASNSGPSNAPSVTVADTFPAALTGVTWTCVGTGGGTCTASGSGNINDTANLPAGGSVTYTVDATIAASATGTLSNTATTIVGGGVTDTNAANNSATDTTTLTPQVDLSITKTDGSPTEVPGTSVTYTIVASNPGPSNDPSATVADTFPAILSGVTWTCVGAGGGTCAASGSGNINETVNLPVGGSVTFTASGNISTSATGTLVNTATVTASVTDTVPGNNSATDTDTLTPQADVSISKTDGVVTAIPGGSVTYTIVASNAGPSDAPGTTIADTFPAILTATWTCVGSAGGTCTAAGSGNINDTVNLPSGGSVTYTINATIAASATGTLSNTATATVGGGVTDPTPGNNSATDTDTLTPQADVSITKTDGQTTDIPGTSIVYTIVASNAGPSNAPSTAIADTFPAALTGITWTCVGAGGGTCTASGSGNINDTANLPTGGSVTYTVNATIAASATGTLSNTSTTAVGGGVTDPNAGNNSATDTTTLTPQADLGITKTDGQTTSVAGASITYTIVVNNVGPSDASGATVADTFSADLVGMTWTCSGSGGGSCPASGSGDINASVNLPVAASVTFIATGSISGTPSQPVITNTATVAAPGGVTDPVPGDNSATDTTSLDAPPEITDLTITPLVINENGSVNLDVTFTDPNTPEPHEVVIDWGDGNSNTINLAIGVLTTSTSHQYLDDNPTGTSSDNYTVSVTVNETDGGTDSDSDTVTVNNVAPVLSAVSATSVNENGSTTLSGNISDVGTQDTFTLNVNWGDGNTDSFTYPAGTTSFNETHQYLDDDPTSTASDNYTISLTLSDDDTGGDTDTATLTVSNVAPTLSNVSATATINEDGSVTLAGDIADPGTQDTFSLLVNWGDGNSDTFVYAAGTTGFSETHQYLDDNPTGTPSDNYTISLTLTDDDTGSDTDGDSVTVNNVAPDLTNLAATPLIISETNSITVTGNIVDPGTLDTFTLVVDWADGNTENFTYSAGTTSFLITHTYQDDALAVVRAPMAAFTIDLTLTDDDTGSDNETVIVTVDNAAPTLNNVSLPASVNEGDVVTLTAVIQDPSPLDTFTLDVDWGDGNTETFTYPAGTTTIDETHLYTDDDPTATPSDSYTVTMTLSDDNGGTDSAVSPITVNNVAPALSGVSATAVSENGSTTLSGAITDPGTGDTFTMTVDWGDGNSDTFTYAAGTTSFDETYQYLDDDPTGTPSDSYAISLTLTDDDTGNDTDSTNVTVNNVAPTLSNLSVVDINEDGTATLTGDIADPGTQDTYTVTVDWGDGITETFNYGAGTAVFTQTHQYLDDDPSGTPADSYTITASVADDDTGTDSETAVFTVSNLAPDLFNVAATPLISETQSVTVTGQISDVGTLDTFTLDVDWGDGSTEQFNYPAGTSSFLLNHSYTDGFAPLSTSYTISLTLTDDDTGSDNETVTIEVDNVAPNLTNVTVSDPINEGDTAALSGDIVEVSPADTFTLTVDWGDGNTESFVYGAGATTFSESHDYPDDNPTATPFDAYTVTLTLADDNGGVDVVVTALTVNNVAPQLSGITVTSTIDENDTAVLSGQITDAGVEDSFALVVDWGDGITETFNYAAGTAVFSQTHQYLDDDPTGTPADTYTINLTLTDDDTGSTADATSLSVNNLAPVVDAGTNQVTSQGTAVSFAGTFTDTGSLDTHTITWDFGDGNTITGTLVPTHTYTSQGVYTVTLTVADDDTGTTSDQLVVTVSGGLVFLPIIMNNVASTYPDLVVSDLIVDNTGVQVVVENIGDAATVEQFWVDVYIDPTTPPTAVNQTWSLLGDEGLVWGVTATLNPGQAITLTIGDAHYHPELSNFSGSITAGTPVYAQADSANSLTTYGAVLEDHEASSDPYNNISGPVSPAVNVLVEITAVSTVPQPIALLPQRQ